MAKEVNFIEEVNSSGRTIWFTEVNGRFQYGTLYYTKEEAYAHYLRVIEDSKRPAPVKKILESKIVRESEDIDSQAVITR